MKMMMKSAAVVTAFAFMLVPVGVLAQPQDDPNSQTTTPGRSNATRLRSETQDHAQTAKTSVEERRAEIAQRVEERRAQVKANVCERRQQNLEKAMPRLSQGAVSVKSSIDTMYGRVAGFYESGQLTVENYDALVEDIELAKADSEAAIEMIEGSTFTLDCGSPNVGQQLDGYRLAVREAKNSLKEYRASLVTLISSMRSAAAGQDDTTGIDDQTEQKSTEEPGNE